MARIRTIKPSFFQSDDVSALPLRARLTWIGLWTQCDDQGRTKDHVRLIKAGVWPLDNVSLADIEEDLATLAAHQRIVRYEVGGERYLEVVNWNEHQKINRPTASRIPAPSNGLAHAGQYAPEPRETEPHGALTDDSLSPHARKGMEGNGREGTRARPREEPPTRCPQHANNPDPPDCRRCGDARRAHDTWRLDRPQGRVELPLDVPRCRRHDGQPANNCGICRSEQIGAA